MISLKLYYSTGACSLTPHIVLHELQQHDPNSTEFDAIAVTLRTHQLKDGTDYYNIQPMGYVPLLVLSNGEQLHETPVIVQYLADAMPAAKLAPVNGTWARYKLQEWLNFIATELHKGGFAPLFQSATPADIKVTVTEKLHKRLAWVNAELTGDFLLSSVDFGYSVADTYLFNVTNWASMLKVDLSMYDNILAFRNRVSLRPAVVAALNAEKSR